MESGSGEKRTFPLLGKGSQKGNLNKFGKHTPGPGAWVDKFYLGEGCREEVHSNKIQGGKGEGTQEGGQNVEHQISQKKKGKQTT